MANYSVHNIKNSFKKSEETNNNQEKGEILEELICYIFEKIPGIEITEKNIIDNLHSVEIDIAFWNDKKKNGFHFLPHTILVECKNWHQPVGHREITYFADILKGRGCEYGFLIAYNGITGDSHDLTAAHSKIAGALREGYRIIVITKDEILGLRNTQGFIKFIKSKLLKLTAKGSSI